MPNDLHVYPIWQEHLHHLKGRWCRCQPRYQQIDEEQSSVRPPPPDVSCVVIHHVIPDQAMLTPRED